MDQDLILQFLSNLINGQTMDYLNDPYSRLGVQQSLQMQAQNQALSGDEVTRLLNLARGIDPRATIPTRSVGSIFNPEIAPSVSDIITRTSNSVTAPTRVSEPTMYGAAYPGIITSGLQAPNYPLPVDPRDTVNRGNHMLQQLSNVGGIFPHTLKDYYIPVFQPRPIINRQSDINPMAPYVPPTVPNNPAVPSRTPFSGRNTTSRGVF